MVILSIDVYTIVICLRVKKYHSNKDHAGEHLFGFEIYTPSAIVLFIQSLFGLIGFFSFLFGLFYSLGPLLDILSGLGIDIMLQILVPRIISIITTVIFLVIDIYTIRKCLLSKKNLS